MKDLRILNVLYEMSDDDSLGIKTCSTVECHLLNWVVFLLLFYVNTVAQWDDSEGLKMLR